MRDEERLYRCLSRALDALRTPEGHDTGAFAMVSELITIYCPKVSRAEATRTQGDFDHRKPT